MKAPPGFAEYVAARGPALVRTAYLLTGDHHAAEDLVQTVLAKAVLRWRSIETSPDAYVRRALYHQNVSTWRRFRLGREETRAELPDRPGEHDDDAVERRMLLRDALARLSPRQRAVLVLRFYEDRTEVETAALLGIGVGTVKSQTRRALTRLRALAPELAELVAASSDPGGPGPDERKVEP
jgi:RNA polymerase sigma-70 factor (sigma-E family)